MAAAAAFCFQIVLDPSEFKSAHNFPLKLRVRFASERADTANATNPPQEKLAAKLYSENTSAEIQQICTTRSTHISALILPGVMLPRTHARAPGDRHKSAADRICYIVSFAREQSYFVTSQNDAEKFSSPPYLKMTKRAALSGAFFPRNTVPDVLSLNSSFLLPKLHRRWGLWMSRSAPRTRSSAIMRGQLLNLQMH